MSRMAAPFVSKCLPFVYKLLSPRLISRINHYLSVIYHDHWIFICEFLLQVIDNLRRNVRLTLKTPSVRKKIFIDRVDKQEDTISRKSKFNQIFPNKYNNCKKWTDSMINGLISHGENPPKKPGTNGKEHARCLRNSIVYLSFFKLERVRHKLPVHQTWQSLIAFQP